MLDALTVIGLEYSAICDLSSALSLIGMRILPHGLVIAFERSR